MATRGFHSVSSSFGRRSELFSEDNHEALAEVYAELNRDFFLRANCDLEHLIYFVCLDLSRSGSRLYSEGGRVLHIEKRWIVDAPFGENDVFEYLVGRGINLSTEQVYKTFRRLEAKGLIAKLYGKEWKMEAFSVNR